MADAGTARGSGRWKLEDAKARFSELVRRANDEGPQTVTVRGREAVVVLGAAEYEKLRPVAPERLPLLEFLQGLDLTGLDVTRERDVGRDFHL